MKAQPEHEPVAWIDEFGNTTFNKERGITPLYTIPPQPKEPEQEPVAVVRTWHKNGDQHAELDDWGLGIALLPDGNHSLYAFQPQRTPLFKNVHSMGRHGDMSITLVFRDCLSASKFFEEAAHNIKE